MLLFLLAFQVLQLFHDFTLLLKNKLGKNLLAFSIHLHLEYMSLQEIMLLRQQEYAGNI